MLNKELEHIVIGNRFAVSRYSPNMAFATQPTIFCHPICPQSSSISISFSILFIFQLNSPKCLLVFRFLLTGVESMPPVVDSFFENRESIEVLAGNLFDGDMGYNMVGFADYITVNSITSTHKAPFRSPDSLLALRFTFTAPTRQSISAK